MTWTNPYDVPDNAIDRQFFGPTTDGMFGRSDNYAGAGATDSGVDPIDTIMAEFKVAQRRSKRTEPQ